MIKVGENTGNLDQTLLNISQFYDSEVRAEIAHMLAMLEPFLTVVLGGILAFIMLSVLGPIYDSFASIGI
jgi:type IV pilus assembly protein PilC